MRLGSLLPVAAALAGLLALAGCGDGRPADQPGLIPPTQVTSPVACRTVAPTAPAPAGAVTDLGTKPTVTASDAPPPCGVVVSDLVVGTGAEAGPGSAVEVKYVGALYATGKEFDSSWSRDAQETLPFTLGTQGVIPGLEQGVTGMREGGRRQVTIPSDLAYGPSGRGPIPPNAALVFVVDLVKATPA